MAKLFVTNRQYVADAYQKTHHEEMPCEVRQGTKEDAQWYACGANQEHGLRRTNADKQRAVELALKHPNGVCLSDSAIADHVGVAPNTVKTHREKLESTSQIAKSDERVGKDGRKTKASSAKRSESQKKKPLVKLLPRASLHKL